MTADSPPDSQPVSGTSTPSTSTSVTSPVAVPAAKPATPYGNLSYAPRQSSFRNSPSSSPATATFKATQGGGFVSHSTFLSAASAQDAGASSSNTNDAVSRLLDECEAIGLSRSSPGYLLVKKLAEEKAPEWRELAHIVTSGQATLLLPVAFKSRSPQTEDSSASITPSFAQDHILFTTSTRNAADAGHVTLSGLRGVAQSGQGNDSLAKLLIKTFVTRSDRIWHADASTRRQPIASQSPLPEASCEDYPYPNYPLLSQTQLVFPQVPNSRARTMSSASLAAPASPSLGHRSTASTSFASLFGGAGRDRRKAPPSTLSDLSSAGGARNDLLTVSGAGSVDTQTTAATTPAISSPDTPVSVWLIDRPLRRSRALRGMVHSVQARLIKQLEREARIPQTIGEVIATFATAFYPPVDSLASQSSSSKSPSPVPSPMYAAAPEEVAVSFQDLYSSVQEQLPHDGEIIAQMELVEKYLTQELYDRLFSPSHSSDRAADKNLSTRIAALNLLGLDWDGLGLDLPSHNGEVRAGLDAILEQCTAVLQTLQGRDAHSPRDKLDVFVAVHRVIVEALDRMPRIAFKAIGEERQGDSQGDGRGNGDGDNVKDGGDSAEAPGDDGDVKQDADTKAKDGTDQHSEAPPSGNTSSADLILPVLIRLIVSANPPSLASHLLFIQRYRNESLLSSGEAAYCLINFQAAVQFIESAKPAELGLDDGALSLVVQEEDSVDTAKSAAIEMLKHVRQEQSGSTTGTPVDLPVGGRMKSLTGVVNSSFSVLGRVIGSGASAGMEAWDRGSKNIEGVKTLEDIRSLLGGSMTKSATTTKELVNMIREKDREGNDGEPTPASPSKAFSTAVRKRASSIRSIGSTRSPLQQQGTDYANVEEQERDLAAAFDLSAPPKAPDTTNKPSIGDRLANLNWKFGMTSPAVTPRDLPPPDEGESRDSQRPSLLLSPHTVSQRSSGSMTPRTPGHASPRLGTDRELPGPPPPVKPTASDRATPLRSPIGSYFPTSPTVPASPNAPTLPASLQSPFPPLSNPPTPERPLHVVLASSGSVASIKIPLIIERLLEYANVRVQVIATQSSLHFYDREQIQTLNTSTPPSKDMAAEYTVASLAQENLHASRGLPPPPTLPSTHLWTDADEWSTWTKVGDPILHIELRRWADIVLVAPCSANTLAKISNGICDNLLTSFLRALSPTTPTILYPAMNTLMYLHPLTAKQIEVVTKDLGYKIEGPIEKRLACGDLGAGAMVEWSDIAQGVVRRFGLVLR